MSEKTERVLLVAAAAWLCLSGWVGSIVVSSWVLDALWPS